MSSAECSTGATSPAARIEGDGDDGGNTAEVNMDCPSPGQDQQLESNNNNDTSGDDIRLAMISDVSNYINFDKLLDPESNTHYGYSEANRSQRQLLDKIKKKRREKDINPLDVSTHRLRFSVLHDRLSESAYRGPTPLTKNGTQLKPVIKALSRSSTGLGSGSSIASVPSLGDGEKEDGSKPRLTRCAFSCVDIREHERIPGDNPCVSKGVPLSIGWGFYQHDPINLDTYEANKGPPRDKIEMMVPEEVRKQMLIQEFNVSLNEINAAIKSVNISKRQRRQTIANEHLEGWEEAMQSAKRKFNRFTKKTSKAKEEEKLWADAQNHKAV